MDDIGVGKRIARHRLRRGLTQAELAGLVGLSVSMVKKVETGERAVTRFALLVRFAEALHIRDLRELTGVPLPLRSDPVGGEGLATALRTALLSRAVTDDVSAARRPSGRERLAELERRVDRAWASWQQASSFRYRAVGAELPALVSEMQLTLASAEREERRKALQLASVTYQLARTWAKRVGEHDVSLVAADRAVTCALDADDPALAGAAAWNLSMILTAQGKVDEAVTVARQSRSALRRTLGGSSETVTAASLAVLGGLTLMEATLAARSDDVAATRALLTEADRCASRTGDTNHYFMAFGPLNVAVHRVSTSTELGRTEEALHLADHVDLASVVPVERRLTFFLDAARCHARQRNDIAAVHLMQRLHRDSPEELRHNALARETLRELAARSRPAWSGDLAPLLVAAALA